MATLTTSAWQGVVANDVKVEAPIKATQVINTAEDQARVYEILTGLDADGSGTATTNAQHDHSENGNSIPRPLAVWQYGTRGPHGRTAASDVLSSAYAAPLSIDETDAAAAKSTGNVAVPVLFYVPTSMVGRTLLFAIHSLNDPGFTATLYNSSMVADASYTDVRLRRLSHLAFDAQGVDAALESTANLLSRSQRSQYGFSFSVGAAGVYCILAKYNVEQTNRYREIYGGVIVPCFDSTGGGFIAPTPSYESIPSNRVYVDSAWQPIDGNIIKTDGPLNAAGLAKIAENNAWLYEKATGLPAPGNITTTVSGHTHDGSSSNGAEIGYMVHNGVLGGHVSDPGAGVELYGNRVICATVTGTSARVVAIGKVYVPKSINTAVGASNIKFAALVYNDGVATNQQRVIASFGSTSLAFDDTAGGVAGTFQVLTTPTAGSNRFAFTQNTQNTFTVELKGQTITTGKMRLCSYVFYLEA